MTGSRYHFEFSGCWNEHKGPFSVHWGTWSSYHIPASSCLWAEPLWPPSCTTKTRQSVLFNTFSPRMRLLHHWMKLSGASCHSHTSYWGNQCLKSSKGFTRFQWNNKGGTTHRWVWTQILKRNARLLREWDTCVLSRSSHPTSSSPPHMLYTHAILWYNINHHKNQRDSELFRWHLGDIAKKGMWRKKWVTALTLETLPSLEKNPRQWWCIHRGKKFPKRGNFCVSFLRFGF